MPLTSRLGFAGLIELVAGALFIVGFKTRSVAFIISGEMAVAYVLAHFPRGFWPLNNSGEPAAILAFVFLFVAMNGGGGFSVDGWLERRTAA